jgi:UDP-2,3-diacylglucosamine pyrophosphatase LpxH
MKRYNFFCIVFTLAFLSCRTLSGGMLNKPVMGSEQPRLSIFISDLHLGVGQKNATTDNSDSGKRKEWSNTEDFRWHAAFQAFLDFINKEGEGKTDLIVVGDMLELWQSSKVKCETRDGVTECRVLDCEHGDPELGCTEEEVLNRIDRIIREHGKFFKSLSTFATQGENRLFILVGNHDAGILYPKVAKRLLFAIPAPEGRVTISGIWVSRDGRILADHGHQFDKANSFANWPEPFVVVQGKRYLYRPTGEQFVQQFYNQYEEVFPIIDNLSTEALGVRLGLEALDLKGISVAINRFFRFLLFQQSWDQTIAFLGKEETKGRPDWDIDRIKREDNIEALLDCFDFNDPVRRIAEKAVTKGQLTISPEDLSDEEIRMVCDCRHRLAQNQSQAGSSEIVSECPIKRGDLGSIKDKLLNRYKSNLRAHLKETYESLKAVDQKARHFEIYIHGHTHKSHRGIPLSIDPSIGWSVLFFNTGAFQRVVTPQEIDEIGRDLGLSEFEILNTLKPENLPPFYSYVRIDPYDPRKSEPNALLRFWVKEGENLWTEKKRRP